MLGPSRKGMQFFCEIYCSIWELFYGFMIQQKKIIGGLSIATIRLDPLYTCLHLLSMLNFEENTFLLQYVHYTSFNVVTCLEYCDITGVALHIKSVCVSNIEI
jgi:hypothetical protein